VTGPHDPEEPWYGTGHDEPSDHAEEAEPAPAWEGDEARAASGPTDPATGPVPSPPVPPQSVLSQAGPSGGTPPQDPPTARSTRVGPPARPRWWRSSRVRTGAAATLAGLVLLGGGFGAGYAVADAAAPAATAHATTAAGPAKAERQAARQRRLAEQRRERQDGGTTAGTTADRTPTF
jgi:hypothetical protein